MKYQNQKCPVCEKPFQEDDDIVVCPDCGAPYHRECYKELGACAFEHLHASGEAWVPEESEEENAANETANPYGKAVRICARCGEEHDDDPEVTHCTTCGFPLSYRRPEVNRPQTNGMPPFGAGPIPFSPMAGTVSPDEDISGIKAKDYATFVGRSAHYFLPRFKELSNAKARVLNWSAFFFQGGYFLYRKMYGIGILMIAAQILLAVPQAYITLQSLTSPMMMNQSALLQNLSTVSMICEGLTWVLRFVCGFFANTLYKAHCDKKINKIKETASEEEYEETLKRKGGVATKLITAFLIGYAALNVIAYIFLFFM